MEKNKKFKLIALMVMLITAFTLVSCGDNNDFENTGDKTDSEDTGSGNKGDEGKDEHTHTYVEKVTNSRMKSESLSVSFKDVPLT